jgi:thymidylate synthase
MVTHYQSRQPAGLRFGHIFQQIRDDLLFSQPFNVGEWQSQKIDTPMREIEGVIFDIHIPDSKEALAHNTRARLPWAEDHFLERVSGEPMNPAPSEAWWPFAKKSATDTNADHKSEGEAFSHTYPERMWASHAWSESDNSTTLAFFNGMEEVVRPHGLRFDYGDLDDVVNQLIKTPYTRQAYLPIWFPEDTGAVHGKRVPCTLGYSFSIRRGELHCSYFMRSTDLLRHFQDDIYMAGRLMQWMCEQITFAQAHEGSPYELVPGTLTFHTTNMHIFEPDIDMIKFRTANNPDSWGEPHV